MSEQKRELGWVEEVFGLFNLEASAWPEGFTEEEIERFKIAGERGYQAGTTLREQALKEAKCPTTSSEDSDHRTQSKKNS